MSRMKKLEKAYDKAGVIGRPMVVQDQNNRDVLRSQAFPSPALKSSAWRRRRSYT